MQVTLKAFRSKRMSPTGYWRDEDDCDYHGNIKQLLADEAQSGMPPMPASEREVVQYHLDFRPHRAASIEYRRIDD